MARTESTMLALDTPAPPFSLRDVATGATYTLASFESERPLLVMFISRHCPYVQHVAAEIAHIGADYAGRVDIVAISPNDATRYPDDAPESMAAMAAATSRSHSPDIESRRPGHEE